MTAASDLQWGRQGGRVGDFQRSSELLADIDRARNHAGADWPSNDGRPARCSACTTGPHHADGQAWCESHAPRCGHCRTVASGLEPVGRGRFCRTCLPDIWAGLARMADAHQAAGQPLDIWDQRALMRRKDHAT